MHLDGLCCNTPKSGTNTNGKMGEHRIKTILKTCLFTNIRQVRPGEIKISKLSLRRLCCLLLVQLQKSTSCTCRLFHFQSATVLGKKLFLVCVRVYWALRMKKTKKNSVSVPYGLVQTWSCPVADPNQHHGRCTCGRSSFSSFRPIPVRPPEKDTYSIIENINQ